MKEFVCINCPLGCNLKVNDTDLTNIKVRGNNCPRGAAYAKSEITDPKRMVTSSVPVRGSVVRRVSVKTSKPIPKDEIFHCLEKIKTVTAWAPVAIGDVLYANISEGVNLVATSEAKKA